MVRAYTTLIEWVRTDKDDVENVAAPVESNVRVASVVVPSLNVTDPVGTPTLEETVAVNVTVWPDRDGLSDEVTPVLVAKRCTTCVRLSLLLW